MQAVRWVAAVAASGSLALTSLAAAQSRATLYAWIRPVDVGISTSAIGGRRTGRVKPGVYRIFVSDRQPYTNFHLVGPGVNRKTGLAFSGAVTWVVRLERGRYRYFTDANAYIVRRSLTVR